MNIFLTIVAFLVIFSVLILIHELGHFTAAKRAGVKVEEFGFGLPPRIFGIKKGETIYSINWIPFGGFVRMLGEDSSTKESRGSSRSFANQPLRTQAWIVVAGVLMNLLLSFILLTIGFLIGIEPLLTSQDDFHAGIRNGTVNVEPGFLVVESNQPYNTVDYNGQDLKIRSFEPGDRILTNGSNEAIKTIEEWEAMILEVLAGAEQPMISMDRANGIGGAEYLTIELLEETEFAPFYLSRLIYKNDSGTLWEGYLQNGDSITSIDGIQILNAEDLYAAMEGKASVELTAYRPGFGDFTLSVSLPLSYPLVSYIEPGSPAELAGLQVDDQILALNSVSTTSSESIMEATMNFASEASITYTLLRGEERLDLEIIPREEDGRIGIGITDLLPNYGNLSLYEGVVPHTLLGFDKVQYGFSAPLVALEEMGRLSKSTAIMFFGVLKQFVSGGGVPEGVSGPVGIAQMTFVTIQDGFAALLRFVALLSLSLGVINILPIPALDGGKFFFILAEAITGKKLSPKYEQIIHAGGFFFLIILIFYITFNDVMNLF